jgi:hypothetical protein
MLPSLPTKPINNGGHGEGRNPRQKRYAHILGRVVFIPTPLPSIERTGKTK